MAKTTDGGGDGNNYNDYTTNNNDAGIELYVVGQDSIGMGGYAAEEFYQNFKIEVKKINRFYFAGPKDTFSRRI